MIKNFMKKLTIFVIVAFLTAQAGAQILLEKTMTESAWVTTLANSGFKYYSMDVTNNQCKLYNADWSPWKTIALPVPSGYTLYDIQYISENLFSTDGLVGLAFMYSKYNSTLQYYTYEVKIIKEDGSVLLTVPNAAYMYVTRTGDGSAKFFLYRYDFATYPYFLGTDVYSLPGMFTGITAPSEDAVTHDSHPWPNPATTSVTIPIPGSVTNSTLTLQVTDISGHVIIDRKLDPAQRSFILNTSSYPAGTYLYSVLSNGSVTLRDQFVVRR